MARPWVLLCMMPGLAMVPTAAAAQIIGTAMYQGCIDLSGKNRVSVTGRAVFRHFAGPPNYESIAGGDRDETRYIITVRNSVCIHDEEGFADPKEQVSDVEIDVFNNPRLEANLRAARGRIVTVEGVGNGPMTGHDHGSLMIDAASVIVR